MRGFLAIMWIVVATVLAAAPAFAQAVSDREDACGWTFEVDSYRSDIAGLDVVLSANDRLSVNGRLLGEHNPIREEQPPLRWADSANSASVGRTNRYILVRTQRTDCIDRTASRIYVIGYAGDLLAESDLWSEHDEWARFNQDREGLTFSSAFYCSQHSQAPAGRAYVFVLRDGAHEFIREERPWASVCEPTSERRVNAVYFSPMQPVSPPP
jgi:hypothetical protein